MVKKLLFSAFASLALALLLLAPVHYQARADQLNVNAQTGTTYTVLNTDCSKLVTFSNASAIAVTLPQASSASGGGAGAGTFMPPCVITFLNLGAGAVTITPTTSTIGGASTLVLQTNQGANVVSDGTNYQVAAGGGGNLLASAWTPNGTVVPTLTALGPTGSHTTVQEWFTLKDATGTTRYIPAY